MTALCTQNLVAVWQMQHTICEDALAGCAAGVMHCTAARHLHAADAQLVVAFVDASVLDIQLGDAAQTQT